MFEEKQYALVTPLFARGSLQDALEVKDKTLFTALERVGACLDVANGISYLHNQDTPILHLDLKRMYNIYCLFVVLSTSSWHGLAS